MKDEAEVRRRVARLKERRLKRLFRGGLKRRPCNCHFNREHTFEKEGQKVTVRLCMAGVERPDWDVDICDTNEQAKNCPIFLLKRTKEEIEADFEVMLQDPDKCRATYPDIYTLSWVLGDVEVEYTFWQRLRLSWEAYRAPKALPAPEDDNDGISENE